MENDPLGALPPGWGKSSFKLYFQVRCLELSVSLTLTSGVERGLESLRPELAEIFMLLNI